MKTLNSNIKLFVPKDIACCPVCKEQINLEIIEFELDEIGRLAATSEGIVLSCSKEPEIFGELWEDFEKEHYNYRAWDKTYLDVHE